MSFLKKYLQLFETTNTFQKIQGTATFETAKLGCQSVGGEMAVITDAAMNEAIRCTEVKILYPN